ncbi:MAG: TetR family transcriptional regulator [Ruminococcus sp.]|nr:TetR family transcriptional regulator [Ruminococcus sp.]
MPKQRFYNLPIEKRERILNAAVSEFSRVPINEVSINKIIKSANISRGSFYQYFDDKNDLIREIMSGYKNDMIDRIKQHSLKKDIDIFNLTLEMLECTITFTEKDNNQRLCFYVFDTMRGNENFFNQIFGTDEIKNVIDMLITLIDSSTFKYSERNDIINVLEIISTLGGKTVIKTIKQPNNKHIYIEEFKRQLMIIKNGILVERS